MSAHNVMANAYEYMTADMRGKLGGYMSSLEQRYGDPRVYAAQRQEMAEQTARVMYNETKTREGALASAYSQGREKTREEHKSRMVQFAQDRRPQSVEDRPESRTPGPDARAGPSAKAQKPARRPASAR